MRKFVSWLIVGAWFLLLGVWFFHEKSKAESPSNPSNPSTTVSQPPVNAPSDSQPTPEAPAPEASEPEAPASEAPAEVSELEALATVQENTKKYSNDIGIVPCYHTVLGRYGVPLDGTLFNLCREYLRSDQAEKDLFYQTLVWYQHQVAPHDLTGIEIWEDISRRGLGLIKYLDYLKFVGFFHRDKNFHIEEFEPGNHLIYLPSEHRCYVIVQLSLDEFLVFHLTCMYQPDPAFAAWPYYDMNTGEWIEFFTDTGLDNK